MTHHISGLTENDGTAGFVESLKKEGTPSLVLWSVDYPLQDPGITKSATYFECSQIGEFCRTIDADHVHLMGELFSVCVLNSAITASNSALSLPNRKSVHLHFHSNLIFDWSPETNYKYVSLAKLLPKLLQGDRYEHLRVILQMALSRSDTGPHIPVWEDELRLQYDFQRVADGKLVHIQFED